MKQKEPVLKDLPAGNVSPRRLLYLLWRYSEKSQTFVYREIEHMRPIADVQVMAWEVRSLAGALSYPPLAIPRGHGSWKLLLPLFWAIFFHPLRLCHASRWGLRHKRAKDVLKAIYVSHWCVKHQIEGIHVHFASEAAELAAVVSHISSIPFGITAHATEIYRPRASLGDLLKKCSWLATISQYNQRFLEDNYQSQSTLIRCGVAKAELAHRECSPPKILTVARLIPSKGLSVAIRALAQLRGRGFQFQWVLVGDGPIREAIQQELHEAGLASSTQWMGAVEHDIVKGLYELGLTAFLFTGIRDPQGGQDGLPVAVLEAMARGVPVACSRISGVPEAIQDGVHGQLFAPGDVAACALALERMLLGGEAINAMAIEARKRVAFAFDSEIGALKLLELINTSLDASKLSA